MVISPQQGKCWMKNLVERRAHRRLDVQLPLEFSSINHARGNNWRSVTQNVSTGGVYFETTIDDIKVGEELSLSFDVGSRDPRFPPNGRINTVAKVVRIEKIKDFFQADTPLIRYGIGAKFSKNLKLAF